MKFEVIAAAAAAAILTAICGAHAAEPGITQMKIAYGDLDLTTDKGQATLMTRVRRAAADACDGEGASQDRLEAHASQKTCMDKAVAAALKTIPGARHAAVAAAKPGPAG